MPAPDPTHTNRAARRGNRSGGSTERRYPAPRQAAVPPPRLWATRRS